MTNKKLTTPFFSVVIPLYNRADILTRTLESVLSQTEQDFEIIVIDDGSQDNPKSIIDRFNDSRIRYIYQINAGGSAARNAGIDCARGSFIALLDSDDTFYPHHLAQAKPHLRVNQNVCTYTQVVVNRGNDVMFLKPHRALLNGEEISEYLLCDRGFIQTSSLILPTKLAVQVRFNETINKNQDTDFAIRLAHAGAKFMMLDQPGACWDDQYRANRLSNNSDPKLAEQWLKSLKGVITKKACIGAHGWIIAKGYALRGNKKRALHLYLRAVVKGCYRPKMAVVIFLQSFMPPLVYRRFSDLLAWFGFKP